MFTIKILKGELLTIRCVICVLCNCACVEHNSLNLILYSGCHDIIHWWTAWYCDPWCISKTFAPQCEVKIVVFIVLFINANFATYYFTYYNV